MNQVNKDLLRGVLFGVGFSLIFWVLFTVLVWTAVGAEPAQVYPQCIRNAQTIAQFSEWLCSDMDGTTATYSRDACRYVPAERNVADFGPATLSLYLCLGAQQ
jgi:hypothetical protein